MKAAGILTPFAMIACVGCSPGDSKDPTPADTQTIDAGAEATRDALTDSGVDSIADSIADSADGPRDTPMTEISGDGADPCFDCMASRCGSELSKCLVDTTCKKQLDCIDACADAACVTKCEADFPTALADELHTCADTFCVKECA